MKYLICSNIGAAKKQFQGSNALSVGVVLITFKVKGGLYLGGAF